MYKGTQDMDFVGLICYDIKIDATFGPLKIRSSDGLPVYGHPHFLFGLCPQRASLKFISLQLKLCTTVYQRFDPIF